MVSQWRYALSRQSVSHTGSFFFSEIRRMVSSLKPGGADSDSTSVTKPYLYSCLTRLSMVSVAVLIEKLFLPGAVCADAVNRHVVSSRLETARDGHAQQFVRQIHIINRPAGAAMKMAVIRHVRAEARRAALHVDLPRQAAFHQRVETIVNRRVRNFRHRALGADKNLL